MLSGACPLALVVLLAAVKCSIVCDIESPGEAAMWHGGCQSEETALVNLDTSNLATETTIDVYFNETDEYKIRSQVVIPGFIVVSLSKSLFTSNISDIVIEVPTTSWSCSSSIILNPTMTDLLVSFPTVWTTDQAITLIASVKTGRGVSFSFTIFKPVNNSLQIEQISIIKACNMSTTEAMLQFTPTSVALYTVDVVAFMDQQYLENTFKVMSGYPIARGSVDFGPNCTNHQRHYYPGDTVNIVINSLVGFQTDRPTSPTCTVDWGDYTVFTEENAELRPDQDTKIMYSQSHKYNRSGNFLISLRCHNLLSEVKESLKVTMESPSEYANVVLQNTVVPLSSATQDAKGVLIFTHPYLKEDYPQLNITVDFGLLNSRKNFNFTYPLQPVEQIYKQKGYYTLTVTFESFGVVKLVTLALRVGVFDFYIINRPSTVPVNQEQIFELVRFLNSEVWGVQINFDPEITNETFPNGIKDLHLPHSYTDAGIKRAVAIVKVNSTEEVAVYEFTTFSGCIEKTDLFEVTYRHELTPLIVLMSDMQDVTARIERSVLCRRTENFIFEWNLSVNIGVAPVYIWEPIHISQPETANFILNNFIYKPGLYKIMLIVTTEEKLTVGDHMFIQVIQPSLVANLLGGTFTQHSMDKLLILDAESVSYDPLSVTPEHSNLSFTWACFMLTSGFDAIEKEIYTTNLTHRIKSPCPIPTLPNQGLVSVPTTNFTDGDLALFEVTAHKFERQETAFEVVQMVQTRLPAVVIECKWNCGTKLVTDERSLLTAKIQCSECDDLEMYYAKYQWSLSIFEPDTGNMSDVPWNENIMSEQSSKSFDSEGGWWQPGTVYKISITVKVGSFSSVTTSRMLFTNLEPYNGTCHVEPEQGVTGETKFAFSFPDWKDEDKRSSRDSVLDVNSILRYYVQQRTDVETPFIYTGAEISTPKTILPACDLCSVDIIVVDPFRGRSTCTVTVKVTNSEFSHTNASEEIQFQLLLQNIDKIREEMDHTVHMGNPVKITQDAATYSTMLNSVELIYSLRTAQAGQQFFNIANMTSRDTLLYLLDPVVITPSQNTLSLAMHQLVLDIGHAIGIAAERHRNDISHLIIFAKSLVTATSHQHLFIGNSLQDVSALAAHLSDMLFAQMDGLHIMGELVECLGATAQLLSNIIETCAIDPHSLEPDPSILQDSGLSSHEKTYLAELLAKRGSYTATSIKEHAPEIVKHSMHAWENLFNVCRQLEYFNGTYEVKTETFSAKVQRTTKEDILKNKTVERDRHFVNSFFLSNIETEDNFSPIHIQVLISRNIFTHGMHSKLITSDIFSASAVSDNGTKLTMTAPGIVYDTGIDDCTVDTNVKVVEPNFTEHDAAFLFYHSFDYLDTNARVCVTVKPSVPVIFYRMYVKTGSEPTDLSYDYRITLSLDTLENCRETCIPAEKLRKVGKVYIGLRPLSAPAVATRRRKRQAVANPFIASYLFGITTVACYNWEAQKADWEASRCQMTHKNRMVTCTCSDGPDLISALSFHFAPNSIHFPTVFSKFDIKYQGGVIGVLLTIYFLFLLGSIWARYKDRKGIFQWGVFPLVDNYADEEYFYLIVVHTGLRKSAGTKSRVCFCLSGELNETGVRQLTNGIREGFPSASILYFVMACPGSLGPLQCLRIWIDNSEKSGNGSWYLDRIDVTDIQTGQIYFFVCEEWLAPEKNTMDKIIATSSLKELQSLKSMLVFNTRKHITDEHIWLSVLIRPEWSRFSRVERLGCCLTFLLLAMITSAMFYRGAPDVDRERPHTGLIIGPIRLSFQQLYYSLVSAVISAIPVAFLVTLFRKARNISEKSDVKAVKSKNTCCSKLPWMAKMEKQLAELEKILLIEPDAEEVKRTWPQCCRPVAWILVFLVVSVCSFFIILYTMEWGRDVTEEWLSSFFLAFIESLFVVDPFKVLLVSFLLSIFIRKTKVKGVGELNLQHIRQVNKENGIKNKTNPPRESVSFLSAVSEEELQAATRKRKIHIMIRKTLWELAIHCIFLIVVCSLCYSNRTAHAYHLHSTVYEDLVGQKATGFSSVKAPVEYFAWLENIFVPWLFPEKDYSGQSIISEDRQYTSVWSLYRLGAPRLRQVRMKKGDCMYDSVDTGPCIDKYSIIQEETREFCLGWSQIPCPSSDQLHVTAGAWYYRSDISILELPIAAEYNTYGGKGYIVNLDINLIIVTAIIQEMKKYFWVDRQTRAVILEFTLYCPNVNHFVYVTLLAEFLETGGVIPFVSIYPFTVNDPPGFFGTYILICELLYIFFTGISLVYVLFVFSKEKWAALKNCWFMVDFAAVIVAITTASMFYLRLSSVNIALSKMKEDRTQFISFQQVVLWDKGVVACLGFLVAIAFFRLLKLAGYSEITMRVYHVLKLAVSIMPSFFVYIFLVIVSFAFLGFGMFSHTSPYFKSFISCLTTLFTGLMGHSSFKETNLPETDQWETVLFFCLFVIICIIFLANLFLAILLDLLTLTAQKDCAAVNYDEAQIFALLWNSLLMKLKLKSDPLILQQKQGAPNVSIAKSHSIIKDHDWVDRIMRIGTRMLTDQDGASIIQFITSTESQKSVINNFSELKDGESLP